MELDEAVEPVRALLTAMIQDRDEADDLAQQMTGN
jgi:hypothetical protein